MALLSENSEIRKIIDEETDRKAVGYYDSEKLELVIVYNGSTDAQRRNLRQKIMQYIDFHALWNSFEKISISYEVDNYLRPVIHRNTVSA